MPRPKHPALKRRLTDITVVKFQAGSAAYLVWDSLQRGLAVRVQPTGHKAFKVIYSRLGRPRWLHLGATDVIPVADARTMAAEALLAVAKGKDPAAEKRAQRGAGTFAELHQHYLDQYAKRHNKSWQQADRLIRRNVLPRWSKLQAASITRSDVKAMMARIEAPVVANQTLAAMSAIFTWGVKEEMVAANPCKLVARNPTKSRERVLSASELPQFWQALADVDPVAAAALKMILIVGQRPGEVAHMRREHLKDGWWEMPGEPSAGIWPGTKNARAHRVWLPKAAQEIIDNVGSADTTGFVFAAPRRGAVTNLDGVTREVCAATGMPLARPHDLRRTHGSTITALGFGRDAMNRIQNHREGGIADVYDRHHYETETKHIMEAVASRLIALAEGRTTDNIVALKTHQRAPQGV
jgi:integrase